MARNRVTISNMNLAQRVSNSGTQVVGAGFNKILVDTSDVVGNTAWYDVVNDYIDGTKLKAGQLFLVHLKLKFTFASSQTLKIEIALDKGATKNQSNLVGSALHKFSISVTNGETAATNIVLNMLVDADCVNNNVEIWADTMGEDPINTEITLVRVA